MFRIDINKALEQFFSFIIAYFRPSLAKVVIWPLLVTGLGFLNPPFWIEIINWILVNQSVSPQYQVPLSEPNGIWGWSLILLSVFVYVVETVAHVVKTKNENNGELAKEVKNLPIKTADKTVDKLKEASFTPHKSAKPSWLISINWLCGRFTGSNSPSR